MAIAVLQPLKRQPITERPGLLIKPEMLDWLQQAVDGPTEETPKPQRHLLISLGIHRC